MSAQLRVVLDQLAQVVAADTAWAALDLTHGLIDTAPAGCTVDAIVPAGSQPEIRGIGEVRTLPLQRRELAASWQLGIAPGVGGGMIHSPSLMAPLVKHDRVHDPDQTVVTLWDLNAWEAPQGMAKPAVSWHRGMLRRAAKHADAIVVPSHAFAERLEDFARFGDRVRVIAGAPPSNLVVPGDAAARRAELDLPETYIVIAGAGESFATGFRAAIAAERDAVVIDAPDGAEPRLVEIASAAGLPARRVHVRGALDPEERASVVAGAEAFVGTSTVTAWPWRAVDAMALGVPVVVVDSGVHRDVVADGGMVVGDDDIADAVVDAVGAGSARLRVLAGDRARAFSWASSAERVWALHADL
ncbi:glycosyltransferase [Microbacterium sp. CIAB417]|uniref:glycosyltransferase n=1 Tax=Microbacterium sp. CIAB417 TaxID=2860287 RepID=UPI001FABCA98|nr:glycosyltransferase [Microbacterium sp. CIAB417]